MKLGERINLNGWNTECIGLLKSKKYQYVIFKGISDNTLKVTVYIGKDINNDISDKSFFQVNWKENTDSKIDYWSLGLSVIQGDFDKIVEEKIKEMKSVFKQSMDN